MSSSAPPPSQTVRLWTHCNMFTELDGALCDICNPVSVCLSRSLWSDAPCQWDSRVDKVDAYRRIIDLRN